MFAKFKLESIPLSDIFLDERNPRIVSQKPLTTQASIIKYFFENEDLEAFTKQIASEGKNPAAERPYVVRDGAKYVVVEGNTRVAAYKLLSGLAKPPAEYANAIPTVSASIKNLFLLWIAQSPQTVNFCCRL